MKTVITTQGIVTSKPSLGSDGVQLQSKRKFKGREVMTGEFDHTYHRSGTVLKLEPEAAQELVDKGVARPFDSAIDDEPDADALGADGDADALK